MKKRRKMTPIQSEECDFVLINIGRIPLKEIKGHLMLCGDCRQFFSENYMDYFSGKGDSHFDVINLPKRLNPEELLKKWHQKKADEYELSDSLEKKIGQKEGINILLSLLEHHTRAFFLLSSKAPKSIIKQETKFLIESYNRLKDFLGPKRFFFLLKGDVNTFKITLQGIKKAFSNKDDK